MARDQRFRLTPVAAAVSAALFTCATQSVLAQSTEEAGILEEVIVTGIRDSMRNNMNIKREAVGVLEAVTAEDIGKFPDTNLAESLQRIPGVSIDRQNGEGSKVTVRGFGPAYNLVTLNGRTLPTATVGITGQRQSTLKSCRSPANSPGTSSAGMSSTITNVPPGTSAFARLAMVRDGSRLWIRLSMPKIRL